MNKLTLGSIRATIARVMNVCADSSKLTSYVNEAQARLVSKGKWLGTVQSYRVCLNSNCAVWPRQIETIESFSTCRFPGVIRNRWFEWNPSGPGIIKEDDCYCGSLLIDKDPVCCFDELDNGNSTSRIQVTTVVPETAGARILLQGYDQNMVWIRTIDALTGNYVDGEYVDIVNARTTTKYWAKLTGVIKPITKGLVVLSEKDDTLSLVVKTLAQYESDETLPIYRKSFVPGLASDTGCGDSNVEGCESKYITVQAKLRHIDVINDTDWLLIQNIGALKLMVQSILKEDRNLFDEAMAYEAKAVKVLQDELDSFDGDGALPTLKYANPQGWGGGVNNALGPTMMWH